MKTNRLPISVRHSLWLLALAFALLTASVHATLYSPPPYLAYQGYLTDGNGNPLGATNTGPKNYNVVFRIWSLQTGGTIGSAAELYAEQQTVTLNNGYYSVLLGQGSPYPPEPYSSPLSGLFTPATATNMYVETVILGIGASGGNLTLSPRLQLLSSPFSFLAQNALYAATAGNLVSGNTTVVSILGNDVGINTAIPVNALSVNGNANITGNLNAGGIFDGSETITNALSAKSAAIAGALNVSTVTVTNSLTANSATINGPLNVTGSLSAQTATVAGTFSSGAATVSSLLNNGKSILNGNVGIGLSAPSKLLEVNGDTLTDGNIYTTLGHIASAVGGPLVLDSSGDIYFRNDSTPGNISNGTDLMHITSSGRVGIGTLTPAAPLDIEESVSQPAITYGYLNGSGVAGHQFPTAIIPANGLSLKTSANILCGGEVDVTSDGRAKEIVRRSDTSKDLAMVRQLQITDYRKIDVVQFGGKLEKGVIAQEVQAVVPEAVSTATNFIPSIYAQSKSLVWTNQMLLVTLEEPHGLVAGDVVRLITGTGELKSVVMAVPSPREFAVAQPATVTGQLFVYGKQVGDFRAVNYDRLFTTGLGAIQELAKRTDELQAKAAQVTELHNQMAEMKTQFAIQQAQMADLKKLVVQLAEATKNSKLTAGAGGTQPSTLTTASLDH